MNQNRVITKKESATRILVALIIIFSAMGSPLKAAYSNVVGEKDTVIILFVSESIAFKGSGSAHPEVAPSKITFQKPYSFFSEIPFATTASLNRIEWHRLHNRMSFVSGQYKLSVNKKLGSETEKEYLYGILYFPYLKLS
jgi:hypothetical protein